MSLKKVLAKVYVESNLTEVKNRWEILKESNVGRDVRARDFINMYGNLGKAQLVRLRNDRRELSRDFSITLEPKEGVRGEFELVLRHLMYNNKKRDGLNTNDRGTAVFGRFDEGNFEGLWEDLERRSVLENKVLKH